MLTKIGFVFASISLGVMAAVSGVQDQEKIHQNTSKFMQRKLDDSRNVVAGLATEDYEMIAKAAQDLMLLSHEADWKVITTPEYLKMSGEFRDAAARLRDAGKKKNLDAATIAYFEVTLSCVRCHRQIRVSARKPGE